MSVREFGTQVYRRLLSFFTSPLMLLTGGVIAAGLVAVVLQPLLLGPSLGRSQTWVVPLHVLMVAVASASLVRVRVRSAIAGIPWTDSAVLICIFLMPAGWVGATVLAGVFLGKLAGRVSPYKALYNASKDALTATAGLIVALHFGLSHVGDPLGRPLAVVAVALTIAVAECAVGLPVITLVSRTPWLRVLRDGVDIRLAFFAGRLVVVMLAFLVLADHQRLLALVPPAAVCLHLLVAGRLRTRSDQVAMQRLATTTERLDSTDLDSVLTAAAGDAVSLFSAERVEVLVRDGPHGPRLARGDAFGGVWSGDPDAAPPQARGAVLVTAPMVGDDGHVGEVRLHLGPGVDLSDREMLTLRTFTSAVRTAARKASAHTMADEMARSSADASRHDPLTGLANRAGLQQRGERLLAEPGLVALVTIDIDGIRDINESLGYAAGDRVLVDVAKRLSTVAGPNDVVARLHGDVFAVVLADLASLADARDRAKALLASLAPAIEVGGVRVRVEATCGLAERAADAPTIHAGAAIVELLRRADVAMWQAKRGGPRVLRYEPDRDPADVDALILGGELPRAIAEREFTVCFQPIVDLRTGQMVAAEALARWRHPIRGELDPRRFLDAVEHSGLLPSFEEAVLEQALLAHARWRAAGVDAPVAVNAGPRSLLDPEFPHRVGRLLARHGVAGSDLVVELTESLTLEDLELAEAALAELTASGVRLALDDFGTRSSPMATVSRLPGVDLKVDMSFVAAMHDSPEALAVVRSTVELGRSLGRMVVAEGVEREDQRLTLWQMGCPAGQGHLFARALPIDEFMRIIVPGTDGVPGRLARPLS